MRSFIYKAGLIFLAVFLLSGFFAGQVIYAVCDDTGQDPDTASCGSGGRPYACVSDVDNLIYCCQADNECNTASTTPQCASPNVCQQNSCYDAEYDPDLSQSCLSVPGAGASYVCCAPNCKERCEANNGSGCAALPACPLPVPQEEISPSFDLCANIKDVNQKRECISCSGTLDAPTGSIWTGLGCVSTDTKGFTKNAFTLAVGLAGGLALVLMLYGSFVITTSTGDPKRHDEGKSIFTAAIAGLLVIIFSVFMLNFLGITIFSLPGF